MIKLTLTSMRSANFFNINSFELQEESLDTFNKFFGLISLIKGLQGKNFMEIDLELKKPGSKSLQDMKVCNR